MFSESDRAGKNVAACTLKRNNGAGNNILFYMKQLGEHAMTWLSTSLWRSTWCLLTLCIILRCLNILCVRTSFVADEYWQSLEVAHHYVFGYGHLTWEWQYKVRSHVYVIWIVWLYKLLKILQLDTVEAVIFVPRIIQAIFSAIADVYYVAFVYKYLKPEIARWAIFVYTTNFFIIYCATRTLTNTVEMNLCIIAAYYFPWISHFDDVKYLWFVGTACAIKPTAFIYWLPLSAIAISKSRKPTKVICYKYIPVICTVLLFTTLLDWYMYGGLYFTWYRFFSFNIVHNISSWYSTHPVFWYFYGGLPVTLGLCTIFFSSFIVRRTFLLTLPNFNDIIDQLLCSVCTCLAVLSMIPHKELRFLLPILPFVSILVAYEICHYKRNVKKPVICFIAIIFILFNTSLIAYFGGKYKSTPLSIMKYVRDFTNPNIMFLLPCHFTPLYSHLHVNITTRFLHCDPPLPNIPRFQQLESITAFEDPISFLEREYGDKWPTHIIILQNMKNIIMKYLISNGYKLLAEIDDGLNYFPEDVSVSIFVRNNNG